MLLLQTLYKLSDLIDIFICYFLIFSHFAILAAIFGFNSVNWPINRLSAPIPIINAAASVKQMCFYSLYSRLSNNKVSQRHRTKTTESPTVSSRRQTTVSLYCAVQSRSPNRRRTTIEKVQSSVRDGTEHAHFLLITSNRPVSRKLNLGLTVQCVSRIFLTWGLLTMR